MKKWWLAVPGLLIVGLLSLRFVGTNQTEASVVRQHLELDSLHEIRTQSKHYDIAQRIDALYRDLNKRRGYNCAVLVARGEEILLARGYGYADYRKNKQLDAHTSFRLASVSKPITATAALMLYDRGDLELQKKVSDYLPGFPYDNITVEMLLCHRSGLPNYMYFVGDYIKGRKPSVITNDDVLQMLIRHKPSLKFNPGKRFQYSNTNYSLLVNIIEKVTGVPYAEFLQENIFMPMHMQDSYLVTGKACTNNVACAYTHGFAKINDDYLDGVVGDKGICCSVTDLYKFHLGLERGLLLKPETKKMAYEPRSFEKKGKNNYGYGWRMKMPEHGDTVIYHNGWWHGYNTLFYRRMADSTVVIVLSN
jgi:CubicO group peptidase (beta-lactamase class C family)